MDVTYNPISSEWDAERRSEEIEEPDDCNGTSFNPLIQNAPKAPRIIEVHSSQYPCFVPDRPPVHLEWHSLSVRTTRPRISLSSVGLGLLKGITSRFRLPPSIGIVQGDDAVVAESKLLLHGVSGEVRGGLWGVMGCSGSGKTTLLTALANRLEPHRFHISGSVMMNKQSITSRLVKTLSGFVAQDDLLHAHFTVLETMLFAADLRLPAALKPAQKTGRVIRLIKLMQLEKCIDTVVGDSRTKGLSGGERKRLCVAIELMMRPKILFLDEPTSGLDSTTTHSLVALLRSLADRSTCAVLCTIHQPPFKTFQMFQNLIILSKGCVVYQGGSDRVLDYFSTAGFPCPVMTNPADHIIEIVALCSLPDERSATASGAIGNHIFVMDDDDDGSDKARMASSAIGLGLDYNSDASGESGVERVPWYRQLVILYNRDMKQHMRQWHVFLLNLVVSVLIASFTGLSVWRDIGTGKPSMSKRMNALFFCVLHQGVVASLQGSHSFPLERAIMLRERQAGAYYVSAYFCAKTLADMTAQIFSPVLFACVAYPLVNFQPGWSPFFVFTSFMVLGSFSATALANLVSCLCVSIELSSVVLVVVYEITRLYGGWFIPPAMLQYYPQWRFADALSFIKYVFIGVWLNEYHDLWLHCDQADLNSKGKCVIPPLTIGPYTGERYAAYYGFDEYSVGFCAGMLVVYIVSCRLLAYFALRYIKV